MTMTPRRPKAIQTGLAATTAGWMLQASPYNIALNAWAVRELRIESHHDVLDVGCGPGVGLDACLRRTQGCVVGLDPAPRMIALALTRHRRALNAGRLHLYTAPFAMRSFGLDERYDRILAVNVLQHLDDGIGGDWAAIRLMRSRLKSGGRVAIVLGPDERSGYPHDWRAAHSDVWVSLSLSGFKSIRHARFGVGALAAHGFFADAA